MNFKYFSQASGKWDLGTQDLSTFEFEIKFRFNPGATTKSWYEILTSGTVTSTANDDVELAIGIYITGYIDVFWGQSSGGTTHTHAFKADPYSWHVLRKFMENGKLICTLDGNYPSDSAGFVPASTSRKVTLFAQSGYYTGYKPANYKVDVEYIKLNTTTYTPQYKNRVKGLYDSLGNGLPGSTNSSYPLTITGYGLENIDMKQIVELTIPEGSVKKIEDSNGNIIWSKPVFPYRRLEYIESTTNTATNQFNIQFDFYCSLTSSNYNHLDIDFQLTKSTFNQSTGQYYGGIASMDGLDCRIGYSDNWTSTFTTYVNGSGTKADITTSAWNTKRHLISIYRGRCYVDSIDRGACLAANTGNGHNISIFNQKYDGSQWNILGKFYKLEVYNTQSGTSYYHRVFPCQRKSDGVIGVYDTIAGRFYTNSGTGTFTAGPVVDEYWDLTAPE